MFALTKHYIHSEKGFAFVAALFACVILLALGGLVIALSVGDIKTSSRMIGDKRSMIAAEKGMHRLIQNFDSVNLAANAKTTVADDLGVDSHSKYEIFTPCVPCGIGAPSGCTCLPQGPDSIELKEYGQPWGLVRYNVWVTGENTMYDTKSTVTAGIGYGPVNLTTLHQ